MSLEVALIPLSQLVPELLLALGGAFLLGNLAAYLRLRPAWREAKRATQSRAEAPGTRAPGTRAPGTRAPGTRAARLPSRTRVLVNVIAGLVVTVVSLAALVTRG